MSYETGEALILTRVQACTGFTSTNTSRADWKLLNSGKSDHYAILKCGGVAAIEWQTLKSYIVRWKTSIEVWQRYKDDSSTATSLYGYVAAILAIMAYPHLGSTIQDSDITEIGQTEEMWAESGGVSWLRQTLTLEWQESIMVSFTE